MLLSFILLLSTALATDLSGVWIGSGNKIIIPFMRDGDIPLLYGDSSGKIVPVWGRWSIQYEHLQFDLPDGSTWQITPGYKDSELNMTKGDQSLSMQRKSMVIKSNAEGIWHSESGDEFIPIVVGDKIYVLHKNKQQDTRVYKGKWKKNKEEMSFQFKAKKKCTVELQSNNTEQADVYCSGNTDTWKRYYVPTQLEEIDLNGFWRSHNLLLKIDLDGFKWKEAYIEHDNSITVYRPEWAGGLVGKKFYLRSTKNNDMLIGTYQKEKDLITLRIEETEVVFYRNP